MAIQNNHSIQQDISNDIAELSQVPICSHSNDEKTKLTREEGTVGGNCETAHREESVATANKDIEIEQSAKILCLKISSFPMVQIGSNSKLYLVQSCKRCSKNCDSSTDEESDSVTNIQEVEADSHGAQGDSVVEPKGKLCPKMPVIEKRGCLNSSEYNSLLAELHDLRGSGDFVAHEQTVQKQLAKTRDFDMEASLQIERAKALYFQNNVEDVKKILKFVLEKEPQLKNPGILTGRALNLLTAVYKRQGKFGPATTCVEKADRALEHHDSPEDKAELYHSYGALLNSLPAAESNKEKVYESYEMARQYTSNNREKMYINVKMAALLLKSCSKAVNNNTSLNKKQKKDLLTAEGHLDLVRDTDMGLGTNIQYLLFLSDLHCCKQNVPMAMERAKEARELIHRHGFELELGSAEKRISSFSEMLSQENEEWRSREMSSTDYLANSEGESSCVE